MNCPKCGEDLQREYCKGYDWQQKRIDALRSALSKLVGSADPKELKQMKEVLLSIPVVDSEKAIVINAIDALLEDCNAKP